MANATSLQMSWLPLQKRKGHPLGLRNLGNTCYLNSVLQCLTYTPPLANLSLLNRHSSSCTSVNGGTTTICPFCLVEKRISRSLTIDLAADSPIRIHNCLSLFAKHFRHGCQEDAHEFLRYVIESCNSVCVKLHKLSAVSKSRTRLDEEKGSKEEPRTIVKEMFGGVLQSQVKCLSCNAESNKLDDIMDLSLDVLQIASLKEAMRRYFQPEILDGSNKYKCEKCKKLSTARKQMSIFEAPNVLVIQLKRFENIHGGKINGFISFEEQLDLAGHMCRASQDPKPQYHLYAAIVHAGFSQESGHYYSYVKDSSGKWFCCNDAHISAVSCQAVLLEKAYILFYARDDSRRNCKNRGGTQSTLQSVRDNSTVASQSRRFTTGLQHDSSKENVFVRKSSPSISSSNRGPGVKPVKFSINKRGSHVQNEKLPPASNGTAERVLMPASSDNDLAKGNLLATQSRLNQSNETSLCPATGMSNGVMGNGQKRINGSHSVLKERQSEQVPDSQNSGTSSGRGSSQQWHIHSEYPTGVVGVSPSVNGYEKYENYQEERELGRINGVKRKASDGPLLGVMANKNGGCSQHANEVARVSNGPSYESCAMEKTDFYKLKHWLAEDSRSWLVHSGWCDSVRDCFRTVKRERLLQDPGSLNLRQELFLSVHDSMRQHIPKDLKEHLIDQLKAYFLSKKPKE